MSELPRLDDLRWWRNGAANDADRVLDAPPVYRCGHKQSHEMERLGLLTLLAMKVPAAGHRQMGAWWMGDHQIPAIVKHFLNRLLQVPLLIALAIEQIAAPCIVAMAAERITHAGAVLTGDEHPHSPCLLASLA